MKMQAQRVIPAPAPVVWQAVAAASDYARFADGIADTQIVSGHEEGMVRVCTDDHGGQWAETCTLWDEGRRYRMTVDVDTYPVYYRVLIRQLDQTWSVEPMPDGTRLTLTFDGRMGLGVVGRAVGAMLGRRRRLDAILDAYEDEILAGLDTAAEDPAGSDGAGPVVT